MKTLAIVLLIASNLLTAAFLFEANKEIEAVTATKTTDQEREIYGQGCVDWIRKEGRVDNLRAIMTTEQDSGGEYLLGRSWKKHGQMVFEVIVPQAIRDIAGDVLCTYDLQSNMMYAYTGAAKKDWLFY